MAVLFRKPSIDEVQVSLRGCFPSLNFASVAFMSEGWDSWVFEAPSGGETYLFRIPKHDYTLRSQARERLLMPKIAPLMPLPVPDMALTCDDGPNGHPFVGYRRLPGEPVAKVPDFRSAGVAEPIGRFLSALHSLPPGDYASAFGLEGQSYGGLARERLDAFYESTIREVFPLISCEAREAAKETFESFLRDDSNFDYQPCIVHADLNADHVLVDPATGAPTGVIDFGDVEIGDPALDWTCIFEGPLAEAMTPAGVEAAIAAYGPEARSYARRARFYRSLFPYHEVLGGLALNDDDILESGLKQLAEAARRRQPCP